MKLAAHEGLTPSFFGIRKSRVGSIPLWVTNNNMPTWRKWLRTSLRMKRSLSKELAGSTPVVGTTNMVSYLKWTETQAANLRGGDSISSEITDITRSDETGST